MALFPKLKFNIGYGFRIYHRECRDMEWFNRIEPKFSLFGMLFSPKMTQKLSRLISSRIS